MQAGHILALITVGTSLLALPVQAKDKDKDKKKNKDSEDYSRESRPSVIYRDRSPTVTIAVPTQRRTYYERPSSTVIVERQRPIYYGQEQRYVERPTYSDRSLEIEVQRGLARQGYYRGPIDGDIGPGSRASIRAFQSDNGLTPTGRIDRQLLAALR